MYRKENQNYSTVYHQLVSGNIDRTVGMLEYMVIASYIFHIYMNIYMNMWSYYAHGVYVAYLHFTIVHDTGRCLSGGSSLISDLLATWRRQTRSYGITPLQL